MANYVEKLRPSCFVAQYDDDQSPESPIGLQTDETFTAGPSSRVEGSSTVAVVGGVYMVDKWIIEDPCNWFRFIHGCRTTAVLKQTELATRKIERDTL